MNNTYRDNVIPLRPAARHSGPEEALLRRSLRPEDPGTDFAEQVFARIDVVPPRGRVRRRGVCWLAGSGVAATMALGVLWGQADTVSPAAGTSGMAATVVYDTPEPHSATVPAMQDPGWARVPSPIPGNVLAKPTPMPA